MAQRLGALARGTAGGVLWGVLVGWFHGASIARGAIVGLELWIPILILSMRWRDGDPVVSAVDAQGEAFL